MANMFNEDGTYNKTEWKPGDRITASKLNKIEESLEAINNNDISRHVEVDARLDILEHNEEMVDNKLEDLEDLIADAKVEVDVAIYEVDSNMKSLEKEMNEGIDEVYAVAETVGDTINQGKADMEAMVDEVEGELTHIENLNELHYNVKDFGAVGDGITDDTLSLQNAINATPEGGTLYFQNKKYVVTATLTVNKVINIVGEGGYVSFNTGGSRNHVTTIVKTNGDINGDSVMHVQGVRNMSIRNIMFSASNSETIQYHDAILEAEAEGNASCGLKTTDVHDSFFENVGATQAKVAGIRATSGTVNTFRYCNACNNYVGFALSVFDSCIEHSWGNHNVAHGLTVDTNYLRVINCRFEWNAQNGVYSTGGEGTYVGNLFDRNGYAGLHLSAGWGHVVTGNYFSRNGCGGDGLTGRFSYSVPGNRSYIETPEAECCHIRLNYMRDVTICGNRYRAGKDDAQGGVHAPCCIYYFSNAIDCKTVGNTGEQDDGNGYGGYTSPHNLYSSRLMKTTDNSSMIFDYVAALRSEYDIPGKGYGEYSSFSIPLTSGDHWEITVFGTCFQKTLRSTIICNKGSNSNLVHVADYGTVKVTAVFNADSTALNVTLSDKSWVKYIVKKLI